MATNGQRPGNPLLGDIPVFVYPSLQLTRNSLRAFRFPIWNPAMYGGQPFLASYQTGLLSPFVVLSVLLPPADALLAHAVVRLLIGGVGMFLFLRRLGLATPAVWFGALTFLLNPFTVVWLEHPPSAVSCWLPWLLWSVDRNRRDGGPGNVALLAALTALTLLAGHPETAFKVLLMTGAYAVAVCLAGTHRGRLGSDCVLLFGRLLPAVLLGAAVAAAQIAPFLEYMGESGIAAMRRTVHRQSAGRSAAGCGRGVRAGRLREPVPECLADQLLRAAGVSRQRGLDPGRRVRGRRDTSRWRVAFLAGTALRGRGAHVRGARREPAVRADPDGRAVRRRRGSAFSRSSRRRHGVDRAQCDVRVRSARAPGTGRGRAMRAALAGLAIMTALVAALIWWQWPVFRQAAFVREMALATRVERRDRVGAPPPSSSAG